MKAIETTGTIDSQGHLVLQEPISLSSPGKVRVIVLAPEDDEITDKDWLKSASVNKAFEFLKDEAEDIYTLNDGKPFHDSI